MVKFFSQTHIYDDPWHIVALAYFLRYPNPYASHVLACDVISRTVTENGTLQTTRLIKKTGAVPKWFPKGFVSRAETWVVEESEVDPEGKVVVCRTKNLDHVKVMQVQEDVVLREGDDGRTLQKTTASIVSNFGFGLTMRIEKYGVAKFKANLERSRQGISDVLSTLRESRRRLGLEPLVLGMGAAASPRSEYSFEASHRIIDDSARDHDMGSMYASASSESARASSIATNNSAGSRFGGGGWLPSWISGRLSRSKSVSVEPSSTSGGSQATPD